MKQENALKRKRQLRLQPPPAFSGFLQPPVSHGILGAPPQALPMSSSLSPLGFWHALPAPPPPHPLISPQLDASPGAYGWRQQAEPIGSHPPPPPPANDRFFQMAWQKGIKNVAGHTSANGLRKRNQSGKPSPCKNGSQSASGNALQGTRKQKTTTPPRPPPEHKQAPKQSLTTLTQPPSGKNVPVVESIDKVLGAEELEEGEIEIDIPAQEGAVMDTINGGHSEPKNHGEATVGTDGCDAKDNHVVQDDLSDKLPHNAPTEDHNLMNEDSESGSVTSDKQKSSCLHGRKLYKHLNDTVSWRDQNVVAHKKLKGCLQLVSHITVQEARRSFIRVCGKLEKALNYLNGFNEMYDMREKAWKSVRDRFTKAVKMAFSGIQAAFAVRSTALGKEQDQNLDLFPRLLELALSLGNLFSSKQVEELEGMLRSMRLHVKLDECNQISTHQASILSVQDRVPDVQDPIINPAETKNPETISVTDIADMENDSRVLASIATTDVIPTVIDGALPDNANREGSGSSSQLLNSMDTDSCLGQQDPSSGASSLYKKFLGTSKLTRLPSPTPKENEEKLQQEVSLMNNAQLHDDSMSSSSSLSRLPSPASSSGEVVQSQLRNFIGNDITALLTSVSENLDGQVNDDLLGASQAPYTLEYDCKSLRTSKTVNSGLKRRDPRRRLRDVQPQAESSHSNDLGSLVLGGRKHERGDDEQDALSKPKEKHARGLLDEPTNISALYCKKKDYIEEGLIGLKASDDFSHFSPETDPQIERSISLEAASPRKQLSSENSFDLENLPDFNLECAKAITNNSLSQLGKGDDSFEDTHSITVGKGDFSKLRMKMRDPRRLLMECAGGNKKGFDHPPKEGASTLGPCSCESIENLVGEAPLKLSLLENTFPSISNERRRDGRLLSELGTAVPPSGSSKPLVKKYTSVKHCVSKLPEGFKGWENLEAIEGLDEKQREVIFEERARRLEEQNRMLNSRKLCLVLDLDHTLLNSAKFSEVDAEWEAVLQATEATENSKINKEGSHKKELYRFPHMNMWTKLRPGIWNFLSKASELFELHVYTMGNKAYATEMARLLDPTGNLFAGRVISKGDDGDGSVDDERPPKSKDLDGVLGMESAVIIIDDSVRVWPYHRHNLIVVERYMYFPSSRRQFGLLGPSLLEIRHDERETDGMLASVLQIIEKIHQDFFLNEWLHDVDVRDVFAAVKRNILAGCKIVFSRVFPQGESQPHLHPLWHTAEQLGAICTTTIGEDVTHVVAISRGTDKAKWATSTGRYAVGPAWLEASAVLYRRANEHDFPVPP